MRLLTVSLLTLLAAATHAQAPEKVALVELFTSEGCSSCPPADALLKQIDGTMPAGTHIIALSEHVTYWNNLGWRDPWSQDLFTDRQRAYGDRFGLDSVYTPQVVVNGAHQVLGSDRKAVLAAVTGTMPSSNMLAIDSVERAGNQLTLRYTLQADQPKAEIWAAIAEDSVTSSVLRGENGGRRLTHVSVARSLTSLGAAKQGSRTTTVQLPEASSGLHLVLFVQHAGQGSVDAIVTKPI